MTGKGLGQREAADKIWLDRRDSSYAMADYLRVVTSVPTRKRWRRGVILDQGSEGSCVGMSGAAFINCEPVSFRKENQLREDYARYLYTESKKVDEWPGTNYEGTSTRALGKVMTQLKWIEPPYVWASTDAEVRAWVLAYGPVIFSTSWTEGMYEVDKAGYVWPNGRDAGGHAYLIFGWDEFDNAICVNSWNEDWGKEGTFKLSRESRNKLYSMGYWSALTVAQLAHKTRKTVTTGVL
jgi:hypothetical protein